MEKLGDVAMTAFFALGALFFVKALNVVPLMLAFLSPQ